MRIPAVAAILCVLLSPSWAQTYRAFGDSIPDGSGATNPATGGWVPLLGNALGVTFQNNAHGGDMAADMVNHSLYTTQVAAGDVTVIQVGTNDERIYNVNNPTGMGYYIDAMRNNLVWLAAGTKTTARAGGTETGTWSNAGINGIGRATTAAGSTKTFTNTGTVAYLSVICVDNGYGASYDILKNGVSIGSFNSNTPGVKTYNGWVYEDRLHRITGLVPGDTITYRFNSGYGYVEWFADNNQTVKPKVYVANVIRQVTGGGSGIGYNAWGGSDANVQAYNAALTSMVGDLNSDGFTNISIVDVYSAIDPTTDLSTIDGLHPNDGGHRKIEAAFQAAIGIAATTLTFQPAPVYRRLNGGVPDGTYWIGDGAAQKQLSTQP